MRCTKLPFVGHLRNADTADEARAAFSHQMRATFTGMRGKYRAEIDRAWREAVKEASPVRQPLR